MVQSISPSTGGQAEALRDQFPSRQVLRSSISCPPVSSSRVAALTTTNGEAGPTPRGSLSVWSGRRSFPPIILAGCFGPLPEVPQRLRSAPCVEQHANFIILCQTRFAGFTPPRWRCYDGKERN